MRTYINIQRVSRLSDGDEAVPLYQKVIKLGEEAGEVSEAFMKMSVNDSDENVAEVVEECCDVINVAIDLINAGNKTKGPDETLYKIDKDDIYYQDICDSSLNVAILYLSSEAGKVSQKFLKLSKAKNVSKSAEGNVDDFMKQTFKVIQASHQVIRKINSNYFLHNDFVRDMFERKLDKWEKKQSEY